VWRRVVIRGSTFIGATIAFWLRRFSPRTRIVFTEPFSNVYSVRSLREILKGGEGVIYSKRYLSQVLLVEHEPVYKVGDHDVLIDAVEPSLKGSPITSVRAIEELRRMLIGEAVFPSCPLSLQLVLYLRMAGIKAFISKESSGYSRLPVSLSAGLLTENPPDPCLSDVCREGIVFVKTARGSISLLVEPFLDEAVHSLSAMLAWSLASDTELATAKILAVELGDLLFIENGDNIQVRVGNFPPDSSSVKTSLHGDSWLRLQLDKVNKRIVGVSGALSRGELPLALLPLLDTGDVCNPKNLRILAVVKSPLFSDNKFLDLLLAAWFKTCRRPSALPMRSL